MSEPKRPKPHEFIWLQWYGVDENETPEPLDYLEEPYEIQWCEDRIFDTDVLYVNADRLDALTAGRDALLSALDDIVTAWELPGDHCELNDAIKAAAELLPCNIDVTNREAQR